MGFLELRGEDVGVLRAVSKIFVLTKGMATIGCRAITEEELEYFGDYRALLLSQRPGITGMWQCGPRNIATFESGLRQKLKL